MKAWLVRKKDEDCATVVFAETRGQAKVRAKGTDACEDAEFMDIECHRAKEMDKYYKPGKTEMDWYNSADRIALVKYAGFWCGFDAFDISECPECPANQWCERYREELA